MSASAVYAQQAEVDYHLSSGLAWIIILGVIYGIAKLLGVKKEQTDKAVFKTIETGFMGMIYLFWGLVAIAGIYFVIQLLSGNVKF